MNSTSKLGMTLHECRNHLNVIKGNILLLSESSGLSQDETEMLDDAIYAANALTELLGDPDLFRD